MTQSLILSFASALFLGFLIGGERERVQQLKHFQDFAGIRSFIFISLLGFLTAYFNAYVVNWFLAVAFPLFFCLIISTYLYNSFVLKHEGMTTELSAILTFLIGYLCLSFTSFAVVLGILVMLLLTLKDFTHRLLEHINQMEFYATIKFIIMAFLILPFLPDVPLDPWGILKPYSLWLIVVFISGISFLGYVLTKIIGLDRGSRYAALFGGVASSTAVTVAYSVESKLVKNDLSATASLVSGVLLAMATSFTRIFFFVYIISPELFWQALIPISSVFCILVITSFVLRVFLHKRKHVLTKFDLPSPFQLKTALEFAVILTIILFVAEIGRRYFGDAGIYLASIFSGIAKGDAIAIAVSKMVVDGKILYAVAVKAMLLSIATSFVSKYVIASIGGTKRFVQWLGMALLIPFLFVITLFFLW